MAAGQKQFPFFWMEGHRELARVADGVILIPQAQDYLTPIPRQLFAYTVAVERGCDVDKTRNLAKSVTVE